MGRHGQVLGEVGVSLWRAFWWQEFYLFLWQDKLSEHSNVLNVEGRRP